MGRGISFRALWKAGLTILGVALFLGNGMVYSFLFSAKKGKRKDRADMRRCVRASLFGSFGQLDGVAGVVKATDSVKIEYTRSANGLTWTQYYSPSFSFF